MAELATEMVAIASRGLAARGEPDPDRWLGPLRGRIEGGLSPSERRLEELRRHGRDVLIRSAQI